MPLQETVNQGREFLDQFGGEGTGWKPISDYEAIEMQQLPSEVLIPKLSAATIALYQEKLKPAFPEKLTSTETMLRELPGDIDPFDVGYTMVEGANQGDVFAVQGYTDRINTLHKQGGYHGIFRPSINEVLAAVDKSNRYDPGDETEYYWTTPFSDDVREGVMWPNVSVEVDYRGEARAISRGEYHLGVTSISSLMKGPFADVVLKEYTRMLEVEGGRIAH